MKVLFAVSNEEISESIVKRYQREYKEIISYKNVYYFNAILKELQKDKNYDRIVISEELEAFTHTQYDQIDKFIFDKLDGISDEASNLKGEDIPIILICSDRREKSESMLVKLFGIGIYNALLGNDRSVDNVCKLLNKPRSKKEAKIYYKIDSDDVTYQSENENDVSEVEIQNILAHYKRLGKDEDKYVESFNRIASQYNDVQLRIITKFLPLNVRAVLEEKSEKYQQIISFNSKVSDNLRAQSIVKRKEEEGTSSKLLTNPDKEKILSKPVVIPSAVNMSGVKKFAKSKPEVEPERIFEPFEPEIETTQTQEPEIEELPMVEETPVIQEIDTEIEEPKKRRGRPRKNPLPEETTVQAPKRGRGRPRKVVPVEESVEEPQTISQQKEKSKIILPGFEDYNEPEENILPGFEEKTEEENILPGFEEKTEEDNILPGFDEKSEENNILPGFGDENGKQEETYNQIETPKQENYYQNYNMNQIQNTYQQHEDIDISSLLTASKKVACFIGTSKNGTSFVVNNLAEITSSMGIDTAILDTTKNRNSYYIYTKNEEELRNTAMNCVNNLLNGNALGINAGKNLTVYTSLPTETEGIENAGAILQTLLKKHSLVLIDCDFDTPMEYFQKTQEIYLVQTFDVLTIQPLTAFLRELKSKNILDQNKLRVILNKAVKIRGINDKTIIGGMAYYNDPAMSFMTELFDKTTVRYITIPFDEDVYAKYLEGVINCEISIKGYPKNIVQIFQELSNIIYPVVSGKATYGSTKGSAKKSTYVPPQIQSNGFTPSMNSTLDQMKKRY
jgi:hypothetical protein